MSVPVNSDSAQPSRLARKLGTFDAVMVGLGSMIGAGMFAVVAQRRRRPG